MSRRIASLLLAATLASGACSTPLGQATPWCDTDVISNAILITAQSVRGASHVPCINELRPGWSYRHLVPRSGETRFWIDSDRVGYGFLEVTFSPTCDVSAAEPVAGDEPGFELYVEELEADFFVEVTVIPEGDDPELRAYAEEVAQEAGSQRIGTRLVRATVDATGVSTAERIDGALGTGAAAFVVGPREREEGTVELHRNGRGSAEADVERGLTPEEALEEVAEPLGDPLYRAVWHYPLTNACVTNRVDAKGIGAEQIRYEVMDAMGFMDLAPLREFGEQLGYVVP